MKPPKPPKPFKPVTLQGRRFTSRVWWTIVVLACGFVLAMFLNLLLDGVFDLIGHALTTPWRDPVPAPAPTERYTAAVLPGVLSIVGAVFLFGLIWGTSLVLDDDDHAFGGHQATLWRTVICTALGAGIVALLCWGTLGLIDLRWATLGALVGCVLGLLGKSWAEHV